MNAPQRLAARRCAAALDWRATMVFERITVTLGDITTLDVDAIVNAANSSLLGGGGVDGAIHRAAGPGLLAECRALGGCATGDAKITGGHGLKARHVIHAVGPVWRDGTRDEDRLLASCYERAIALARAHGVRTLAFPCISTGVYGYPMRAAARVAVHAVARTIADSALPERVILCAFDQAAFEVLRSALRNETLGAFPSFTALFERDERLQVTPYLSLLNASSGAGTAVALVRESTARSGNLDLEIAALLAQNNWRPQLVGAVALILAGPSEGRLAALWEAIDRPCWVSPQLVATVSLVDANFDAQARMRLDRRGTLDARDVLAMPWPERHSAIGPNSIDGHAAKTLSAFLSICEGRSSASAWIRPYLADEQLRGIVAQDQDGGGGIARDWLQSMVTLRGPA
jgi:O-acetyl-ADP-ribose deacetylase (regulator of RNase III)